MCPKEILKLAKACRKAGIKHFKTAEYEFTLTDSETYEPKKRQAKAEKKDAVGPQTPFETDSLTDEQLLRWSAGYDEQE